MVSHGPSAAPPYSHRASPPTPPLTFLRAIPVAVLGAGCGRPGRHPGRSGRGRRRVGCDLGHGRARWSVAGAGSRVGADPAALTTGPARPRGCSDGGGAGWDRQDGVVGGRPGGSGGGRFPGDARRAAPSWSGSSPSGWCASCSSRSWRRHRSRSGPYCWMGRPGSRPSCWPSLAWVTRRDMAPVAPIRRSRCCTGCTGCAPIWPRMRPLALLVDDIHWADVASLRFSRLPVATPGGACTRVLLGARPAETGENQGLLAALMVDPATEVVTVEPLTTLGVARLVAAGLGVEPAPEFAAACREATGGTPFLVAHADRSSAGEGDRPAQVRPPKSREGRN